MCGQTPRASWQKLNELNSTLQSREERVCTLNLARLMPSETQNHYFPQNSDSPQGLGANPKTVKIQNKEEI